MNNKRQIKWEPMHLDDYAFDIHDASTLHEDSPDEEDEPGFNDYEYNKFKNRVNKLPKIAPTPFGLCRVDDKMNPLKRFNFWIGHTNFPITQIIAEIIDDTPGVEVFQINTPYRFILAVGQMFNQTDVRMDIERVLCGKHKFTYCLKAINDAEVKTKVIQARAQLLEHKFWNLYIYPNGETEAMTAENRNEFIEHYNSLDDVRALSGGILISSEDEHAPEQDKSI